MSKTYSYSRISAYENCPLNFKFKYVDGMGPLRWNIEAFVGNRVHEALEKLYRAKLFHKTCELDELLDFYREKWRKKMVDDIHIAKEDYDEENYRLMGEKYIRDYYNSYRPFDRGTTIALEKKVSFPLDEYKIIGFIDRITEVDGIYEIHDYKTSLYLPTREEIDGDEQLPLYALALKKMYDPQDIELVWHYVAFNKEIRSKRTDEELEEVEKNTISKIMEIERAINEEVFNPKKSALCPYCEYQPICPLFKHEYELGELPLEKMGKEEGYGLVNKYWDTENKIKELERRKKELEEQLIQYSREHDVQYIYGSEKIANVKTYENPWFPDSKDSMRKEFEQILKDNNIYDEYSIPNLRSLSSAYRKGELPENIKEKLEKYMKMRKVTRIYLRSKEKEK